MTKTERQRGQKKRDTGQETERQNWGRERDKRRNTHKETETELKRNSKRI